MAIVATNKSKLLLEAIRELARYREEDPVATAFNVGNSFFATNEQWRARNPKTVPEILAHYRECAPQVEQQVFATYGIPGEVTLREKFCGMVEAPATVLDFGAGIGSQLVPLVAKGCQCVHVDVGGVMMDYASWRYQQIAPPRGPSGGHAGHMVSNGVEMVSLKDDYMEAGVWELKGRQFDVVICTEVIEHVTEPERFVAMLADYVKPGGLCVATTSFHDVDGMIPMHLNIDKYSDATFAAEVFPRHRLVEFDEFFYRKWSA
jgi:2-polyprenyl-3-methyl-5-hydroxy-6-metoxy-1,4-benzoquinol methylase